VEQIRMNATLVQNVVTYDTVIDFDNPELKLFPGMTAYVTIPVATATDVLRVPNMALRFKPELPAAKIQEICKQYGIAGGACRDTSAKNVVPGSGQGGGNRQGGMNETQDAGGSARP